VISGQLEVLGDQSRSSIEGRSEELRCLKNPVYGILQTKTIRVIRVFRAAKPVPEKGFFGTDFTDGTDGMGAGKVKGFRLSQQSHRLRRKG
jgi:hypothetical protein